MEPWIITATIKPFYLSPSLQLFISALPLSPVPGHLFQEDGPVHDDHEEVEGEEDHAGVAEADAVHEEAGRGGAEEVAKVERGRPQACHVVVSEVV